MVTIMNDPEAPVENLQYRARRVRQLYRETSGLTQGLRQKKARRCQQESRQLISAADCLQNALEVLMLARRHAHLRGDVSNGPGRLVPAVAPQHGHILPAEAAPVL